MSQSVAPQKQLNPHIALASVTLFVTFSIAGCSDMGMGALFTPSAVKMTNGTLTDQHDMTPYAFNHGTTVGKNVCNSKCVENRSPLATSNADKPSSDYTIITRDDGKKQWTYHGKPLYLWTKGKMPGDQTGGGLMDVWRIVKP